mmetsp:Transcript_56005/g.50370  ORF Transcript_56005/g.50370 Transcript_56005/m.50370 type:complete len:119 (-) Transcript_56005:185-541(-)
MPSVDFKMTCPHRSCPDYGKAIQWEKTSCGHNEKIDTDCDVFCVKKCKWSNGSSYIFVGDLDFKCNKCHNKGKCSLRALAAAMVKNISAMMIGVGASKEDRTVWSTIIAKMADKISSS